MELVVSQASCFEDFVVQIREMMPAEDSLRNEFWFRGQSNADWKLETSLMRSCCKLKLTEKEVTELESVALKAFEWSAHLHVKPEFLSMVRTIPCWWAI